MISQQQILINFSYTNTIPNDTKNPMTESKKFCMKGLTVLENKLRPHVKEGNGFPQYKKSRMIRKEGFPMIGPKKSSMKGLQNPRISSSVYDDSEIFGRHYIQKKIKVINTDITTKSKYGVSPSLVCCIFLIKSIFSSFLFTLITNLKK